MSLPAWPKTWISAVLATVGVPPVTAIAPPFTRIFPAASRLIVIELLAASPNTVRTPPLKDAVVAAWAGAVAASDTAAASTAPTSNRWVRRRQVLRLRFIVCSLWCGWRGRNRVRRGTLP